MQLLMSSIAFIKLNFLNVPVMSQSCHWQYLQNTASVATNTASVASLLGTKPFFTDVNSASDVQSRGRIIHMLKPSAMFHSTLQIIDIEWFVPMILTLLNVNVCSVYVKIIGTNHSISIICRVE